MSLFELKMPKLGESVTEGTIGKWLKQPGEKVEKYDLLVEVQTDKVNTEIPSPVAGTLKEVKVQEGQILARNGDPNQVPDWEKGRKDVYRLRPGGSVTIALQFRDWGGMFMEHCHNTVHEDNAMLLRWEIDDNGAPFVRPLPTPISKPQGVTFQPPDDVLPGAL